MQPKGFADSFFSPDYAAGLGVLFQKLNQVAIPLLVWVLINRGVSKTRNYYPLHKRVQMQKKHTAFNFKSLLETQFEKEDSLVMTVQVLEKPLKG